MSCPRHIDPGLLVALVALLLFAITACAELEESVVYGPSPAGDAPSLNLTHFRDLHRDRDLDPNGDLDPKGEYRVANLNYCAGAPEQRAVVLISKRMAQCMSGGCDDKPRYAVSLLIHGQPGDPEEARYLAWQEAFVDRDIVSVSIDYAEHHADRWNLLKNTEEARCAVRFIRALAAQSDPLSPNPLGLDADNITVAGHSMGSLVAQSLLFAPADGDAPVCVVDGADIIDRVDVPTYQLRILAGMGVAQEDAAAGCHRIGADDWDSRNAVVQEIAAKWPGVSTRVRGGVLASTMLDFTDISSECTIRPSLLDDPNLPLIAYRSSPKDDSGINAKQDGEIYCGRYRDLQLAARSFNFGHDLQATAFRWLAALYMGEPNALAQLAASPVEGYEQALHDPARYEEIVPLSAYLERGLRARLEQLSPSSLVPIAHERVPVLIMQGRRDHFESPWPGGVALGMVLRQRGYVAETITVPGIDHTWKEQVGGPDKQPTRSMISADFAKVLACAGGEGTTGCSGAPVRPERWIEPISPERWIEAIPKTYDGVEVLDRYASAGTPRILLRPNISAVTRPHQGDLLRRSFDRLINAEQAHHRLYTGLRYRYDLHYVTARGRGWEDRAHELIWQVSGPDGARLPSVYEGGINGPAPLDRDYGPCPTIELLPVRSGGPAESFVDSWGEDKLEPWCQFRLAIPADGARYAITARAAASGAPTTVIIDVLPHPMAGERFPVEVRHTAWLWQRFDEVRWPQLSSSLRPGGLVDVFGSGSEQPLVTADGEPAMAVRQSRAVFRRDAAKEYRACFTGTSICSDWRAPE